MSEPGSGPGDSGSVEFFDALAQLWAGRWWILLVTAVSTAILATAAYLMTPVYRAATVLAPVTQERAGLGGLLSSALGSFGGLASMAGITGGGSPTQGTDEAVAVLSSRQFLERFIAERQLLPLLFADKWDATTGRWRVPLEKQPGTSAGVRVFLHDVLTVTQDKKTGLITLQIDSTDRTAAADWANELVRRLNAWMRARAIANSDAAIVYLRKEMDAASIVETRVAISRLMEAQINQRMISSVTDEFSFRVVDPAYVPERGDIARPKKSLMIMFGILAGGVLGAAFVILFRLPRRPVGRRA